VVITPKLPPGAVSNVTATAGPGSATVNFTAPATGGPPTRYTVIPYIGSTAQDSVTVTGNPPATSVKVSGLDPATSYTFKVQAANGSGTGPLSSASNAITPTAPTAPAAPTGLIASASNQQATVRWSAPDDGGRTITRYTVTPYLNGVAQTTTTVTGSPAPTTAVVTGLTNGSSYTFTVSATNSVGTGPDSAASSAVTPSAAPRFVQRVSGRSDASTTLQLTPTSSISSGNRIVVMAGVWSAGRATISGVTDSAGNTYTKVTSVTASEDTELSIWSAPVTAGGGTRPTITVTATGSADIGGAALEYAGLSTASGATAVDALKTATGTSGTAGYVTSGPTAPLAGDNGLAMGFYADSGFGRTLAADPTYTERVNVSPTSDMEFVVEDALPLRGDTPAARVSTGASTPWTMATVVFKTGTSSPPALSVSPSSLSFSATAGGSSPAAKTLSVSNGGGGSMDWTASESASWLSVSPTSGTNSGTITVTPSISGLAAGTYTTDVTVTATGATGSPKTIPVTLTVDPPAPPALSVSPTSLAFTAVQGGANPPAQTVSVTNTGGGTLDVTASDDASWLTVTPASATAPATLSVSPSVTGLAAGTYSATVTVTATTAGATGSPKTIAVTLTVTSAASNLIGAWGFDETSGTTAADASGRGNTGTLNGPTWNTAGKFGGALSFDGVNDWVTVADADVLDLTTGMTMEAWVRPTAVGSLWRTVMLKEQPGSLIYALYAGDGRGRAATDVFTSSDLGLSGTTATALNAWTHLAATYDGATLRLYVNGVQAATRAVTGSIRASTGALRIGGNGTWNNEWFAGLIDEVRLYNRALTAAEIQADMAKPVTGG
jgi:hypothetical protein